MAGNNLKMKLRFLFVLSVFICFALFNLHCDSKKSGVEEIPFKKGEVNYTSWDDLFEKSEIISFKFSDPETELYSVNILNVNSKGDYIILDPKNPRRIILFNSSGQFVKYIGGIGEGPGENMLPSCMFLDKQDNLYVYDLGKRIINKYSFNDYTFEKQVPMVETIQDAIVDAAGNFITYRMNSEKNRVLFKNAPDGNLIKTTYTPGDERLRVFLARFALGRMSEISNQGFLFFYPSEYKIYFLDYDFNPIKTLYGDSSSTYQPYMGQLPKELSPYEFSREHSKWWSQALRPAVIYYLSDRLFMVGLIRYNNLSEKRYVNIHDLNGITYAEGIEVPFNGLIRFAKDGYVFVVEDSKFDENENVLPLQLHRFKIKKIL